MNTFAPSLPVPYRLCRAALIVVAVALGLLIPLMGDMKMQTQAIVVAVFLGLGVYFVIPNQRISLVCAWVLIFPLSLEKVFPWLHPTYAGFLMPPFVISGSDLVLGLLIVTMVVESFASEHRVFFWTPIILPYALLVVWVYLMFLSKTPTHEGIPQVLHWTKMLLFIVVMSSAIRTREEILTVLVAVAAAVLVQSVILGTSYWLKRPITFSPKIANTALISISSSGGVLTRATGTVGHTNQQATYQILYSVPLVALFMVRNWIWRAVAAIVLLASFIAVVLTFTRSSWTAGPIAAAIILVLSVRHRRITQRGWLGVCLGIVTAMAIAACFARPIFTRLIKADDGASASRVHLALLSLEHITNNPIGGVGPGNFITAKVAQGQAVQWASNVWLKKGYHYQPRFFGDMEIDIINVGDLWYYSSLPAHNKFLLVGAELGLVGLALFVWFQWKLLRSTLSGLRTHDPQLWWVGACLLGSFGASLCIFMLDLFYDDKSVLLPLFVNALMISFSRIALQHSDENGKVSA